MLNPGLGGFQKEGKCSINISYVTHNAMHHMNRASVSLQLSHDAGVELGQA